MKPVCPAPLQPDITLNCEYHDINSINLLYPNSQHFIAASINIQSLNSKFQDLKSLIETLPQSLQIIALQETWNIPFPQTVDIPNFNFTHLQRSKSNGGGVGFYIKKDINFAVISNLSTFINKTFESLTISIPWNNSQLLFSTLYRPPSADLNSFISHLENHLIQLSATNHPVIILTDSNINILHITNHHNHFPFYQIMYENGFYQCINLATRFSNQSFTAIDHIITNLRAQSINTGVILTDISDHLMTFIEIPNPPPPSNNPQPSLKSNYSHQSLTNFKNALSNLTWHDVLQSREVNKCYDLFWDTFSPLLDIYFPKTQTKFNKNIHKKTNS